MKNRKQAYHIETEKGLINDPNGLSYFKGKYYVFFQWNPNVTDHSYKVWGKTTSQDLVHWSEPVIALQASEAYDKDGTYSGSAVSDGETLFLYYTGNVKREGVRYPEQCLAQSKDGVHFKKYGSVLSLPDDYTGHFRDPKVTKEDVWKMIIGGQNKKTGKGDISQYTSIDGTSFKFNKIIGISKQYEMIECPDLFTLDAHEVLIYGLQSRNNDTDECLDAHAVYLIDTLSDLDKGLHMDEGYDFYAPQTFVDAQGRRIMLAWMSRFSDAQEVEFAKDGHIHCLTMPRELSVKKGKLIQSPVREMYELCHEIPYTNHMKIQRQAMIEISPLEYISFSINKELSIHFNEGISIERYDWAEQKYQKKSWPIKINHMEIWLDTSSVEIFANNGEFVYSARLDPQAEDLLLASSKESQNINVYRLEI